MPTYTVTNAELKRAVPDGKYGPMQVIALDLRDQDGKEMPAEWYTKASTPLPQPGSSVEGTVELGDYGWKFKKAPPPGGFGGGGTFRPRDPAESAAIVRQHSQNMALRTIELGLTAGIFEAPTDGRSFFALVAKTADWFDKDVAAAKGRAA